MTTGPPSARVSRPPHHDGPYRSAGSPGHHEPAPGAPRVGPPDGPLPSGFVPTSFTWISRDEGWVLGDAPCSRPPCPSIILAATSGASFLYRTTDGGRTWTTVRREPGSDEEIAELGFTNARLGWAIEVGGEAGTKTTLLRTTDAGRTWEVVAFRD